MHLVAPDRSYSPETIAVMTAAFDRVCQSLSPRLSANEDVKCSLALAILRLVDRGERDPKILAEAAFRVLAGIDPFGSAKLTSKEDRSDIDCSAPG